MKVTAFITNPDEVNKILECLKKIMHRRSIRF